MSVALSQRGRTLLLFLSAAGYIAWFSGLGERGDAQDFAGPMAVAPRAMLVLERAPALRILRDPFAGAPEATQIDPGPAPAPNAIVPNIEPSAAPSASPLAAMPLLLRATIAGPNPVAYVEHGSSMDLVRVGDTIGTLQVAKIDLRGISFVGGTHLELTETHAPGQRPARTSEPQFGLRFSDIRRLLGIRSPAEPIARPRDLRPTAGAEPNDPTPGPLPTADDRGLTVGTNPTADSNGATPRPYPYPYAPPR